MGKGFSCSFRDTKLCEHKKSAKRVVLNRCFRCPIFRKFLREMDLEEDEFFAKADRARGTG